MPKATRKAVSKKAKSSKKTKPVTPQLPSYVGFSKQVFYRLREHKETFGRLGLVLFGALFLITGISQQDRYASLTAVTQEVSGQITSGLLKVVVEVGALFSSVASGTLTSGLSESQQLYVGILYVLAWLTVVWLLRYFLSGKAVSMRDGLYSAGAPLVSTLIIGVIGLIQLLPLALLVALVSTLSATGVFGVWLLFPASVLLVMATAITLYWITSTVFAAIIVTIPGMYPGVAFTNAQELVRGYRLALIKRILWLLLILFVVFFVATVPVILFDALLGYPFALIVTAWIMLTGVALFLYGAAYLYLLYREIIDERA